MAIAQLDGVSLYYEVHGQGQPLLLISGFAANHLVWSSVCTALSEHYQVIVFDNRGAGQSSVPAGPYSIEQMADDVAALCRYLSIEKAFFCGSSMGGCILQSLMHRHPALTEKAIIANSTLTMNTTFRYYIEAQFDLLQADTDKRCLATMSSSFVYSYHFLSQPGILTSIVDLKMLDPHPISLKAYQAQMQALNHFDARSFAGVIDTPVLVIGADEDLIFNQNVTEAVAKAIPHAAYYCFERCGHLPQIEYPELFSKVIMDFL